MKSMVFFYLHNCYYEKRCKLSDVLDYIQPTNYIVASTEYSDDYKKYARLHCDNAYDKLSLYHELDDIDNKKDLLEFYLKVNDEYGKLPKEVEALFDKKKLELLVNLNLIDKVINRNGIFRIVLSKNYSDNIDGIKLFEYCGKLSKDININYKESKLIIDIENQKENISKMLTLVDNLDKLEKDENR